MIKAEGLTLKYGSGTVAAKDVSFEIGEGEIVGFAGPNGAGKTTVIKMITGILKPTEGQASICGFDVVKQPMEAKKRFAFISDNPDVMLQLTGEEYINFIADIYQVPTVERKSRIKTLAERFKIKDKLNIQMREYSHGMRQKVMIISSLVHEPDVWILDEPMTGLDPTASYELKQLMKEHVAKGKSVLFSTHVLEVAEKLCDRILIIDRGVIVYSGTVEALMEDNYGKGLEEIFVSLTSGDE